MSTAPTKTKIEAVEAGPETELPGGWATAKISSIFDYWGGMTPSTSNASYWGGKIPWVSSKDVKSPRIKGGADFITQKALEETRLRLCPAGTVVVVVRSGILANTFPVAIVDSPVTINQDLKAFWSREASLNEWLAFSLKALERQILTENRKDGTTVQSIRVEQLTNLALPVPPLGEQKRILTKTDELLARVQPITGRLTRASTLLRLFRQAVLAAACSGKLTEDWRQEHGPVEPVTRLIDRIFEDRLRRYEKRCRAAKANGGAAPKRPFNLTRAIVPTDGPELPSSWEWATWNDIVDWVTYGFTRPMPHVDKGIPIITAKNIFASQISFDSADLFSPSPGQRSSRVNSSSMNTQKRCPFKESNFAKCHATLGCVAKGYML